MGTKLIFKTWCGTLGLLIMPYSVCGTIRKGLVNIFYSGFPQGEPVNCGSELNQGREWLLPGACGQCSTHRGFSLSLCLLLVPGGTALVLVAKAGRQKADVSLSMYVVFKHPHPSQALSISVIIFRPLSLLPIPCLCLTSTVVREVRYLAGERGREFLDEEGDPVAKL